MSGFATPAPSAYRSAPFSEKHRLQVVEMMRRRWRRVSRRRRCD